MLGTQMRFFFLSFFPWWLIRRAPCGDLGRGRGSQPTGASWLCCHCHLFIGKLYITVLRKLFLSFCFMVWLIYFADWSKTHVPFGKGFSFYVLQVYQGRIIIRCVKENISIKLSIYRPRISKERNTHLI